VEFRVDYHSNIEIGQIIQHCDCADAFVEVIPLYKREKSPIPFRASLTNSHNDFIIEETGHVVDTWQTKKHGINTYILDVSPNIGTTHHDYRNVPFGSAFQSAISFQVNKTAFVTGKISRKESVIYDVPYNFVITDDLTANPEATIGESGLLAAMTNDFGDWPQYITASASRFGVPKILILAIAVIETTHGWYDEPLEWVGQNKSIRPMNINVAYWHDLFTDTDMHVVRQNFDAGAFMLKRIIERLAPNDRTVRKIATLYNNINAGSVTDYGARVEVFTKTLRPEWL